MSSILGSRGVVVATAMAVSASLIFLARHRTQFSGSQHSRPANPILRSCLTSEGKKSKRKKKRVQFAETVKDESGNSEELRTESKGSRELKRICRSQTQLHGMPANRVALYHGMLRDRVRRMECSY